MNLNTEQRLAVDTLAGPLLIIAGAGSGKTRVITERIANMLRHGIPQHAILALTFTNKAAHEMQSRVRQITGRKLHALTVSTFHAFGVKILREDIEQLNPPDATNTTPQYRKNFSIYDETDRNQLIKDSLRECKVALDGVDLYKIGQMFSGVKTGMLQWGAGINGANSEFKHVYDTYQENLRVFNAVDFDDLLALPIKLFLARPEILEKYQQRFRYIMVDEFQDTSRIQYELLRLISRGGAEAQGKNANICVVGDDDQSIYSWRGANYENLLLFEKDFPTVLEIKLEQNYRSTGSILDAANGVISHNANRKEKALWSGKEAGKPLEFIQLDGEKDEAEYIAERIHELRFGEHRKFGDFGILVRTNNLMEAIEESLLDKNIPYRISGGQSFFGRKEIKDVLSYLRVIANPRDDVNLLRIINTPRRGIGKTTIARLSGLAARNKSSIWDAMDRIRQAAKADKDLFGEAKAENAEIESFMDIIEEGREAMLRAGHKESGKPASLSQAVQALVDKIDYYAYLVAEFANKDKDENNAAKWKYMNIERLISSMADWEKDDDTEDAGLYAYLNRISLLTHDDSDDEDDTKVSLMTIHAAKGLEFPVVFIAGAEANLIPHARALADTEDEASYNAVLEEERRLFYVALTRAQDKLYISACRRRNARAVKAGEDEIAPSPFLEEIPEGLLQYAEPEKELTDEEADAGFEALKAKFHV
ncbi:MAG: UvrD-helicase domain-containing protein [Spirochaetaceae bacterium]|jgi:DNA helicase-2/ATP-dependent DNA helicase PcrA|nr:UvrD-helicase domain-containing protein [Spirochaetaceae bacterium]